MFGLPAGSELILILVIVLIVFGAGKLPSVGRSLGQAITEFKESVSPKDREKSDSDEKDESKKA